MLKWGIGIKKGENEMNSANHKALAPDEAGYRSSKAWWPDLTNYHKAILLQHTTFADIANLLQEYAQIWTDKHAVRCDFFYTTLPADKTWAYLAFPTIEGAPHYVNFWNYQNLLIWLTQKANKAFCLAMPHDQRQPLFLATPDSQNPYGDSCVGIYADRDFYFELPAEILEWGPVPTSAFDIAGFLQTAFQFDTHWLTQMAACHWHKSQIVLTFSE